MSKLEIVQYPNKILKKNTRPISKVTPSRKSKILEMLKLMYNLNGMGLAAPQVGWDARVFVMNTTYNLSDEMVFINPIVLEESEEQWEMEEGCLSFPGITGAVTRSSRVKIKALDLDGNPFIFEDDQLAARCVLHEVDHLQGILFIDKADKLYRGNDPL